MKTRIFNIVYDLEKPHYEVFSQNELPRELFVDTGGFDDVDLANLISDETGWCVVSYDFEEVQ